MDRRICVCLEFLTEAHRARIAQTARETGFAVSFFTPEQLGEAMACVPGCEILYAHSPELVRAGSEELKWFCCSWAGVELYCRDKSFFRNPACLLTNSAGAYGVTISEHILMVLLMLLRRMPEFQQVMARRGWSDQLPVRSVFGSPITVLGTGDLGTTFARKARLLGAGPLVGVSRSGRARTAGVFDEMHPFTELDAVLPRTQILVMCLPGTPETANILDRRRIGLLAPDAFVVNVGRGAALDQDALAEALNAGRLAGAALDVMVPEPLLPDSPLWSARNLILTPHVAGNMSLGYTCDRDVEMFCQDLRSYAAGRPLAHLVDRSRGY
jgi:phosphoglycerate dehydrogenase-like enzyme